MEQTRARQDYCCLSFEADCRKLESIDCRSHFDLILGQGSTFRFCEFRLYLKTCTQLGTRIIQELLGLTHGKEVKKGSEPSNAPRSQRFSFGENPSWSSVLVGSKSCLIRSILVAISEDSFRRRAWQTLSKASSSVTSYHSPCSCRCLRKRSCCAVKAPRISFAISLFSQRPAWLYRSLCRRMSLRKRILPGWTIYKSLDYVSAIPSVNVLRFYIDVLIHKPVEK